MISSGIIRRIDELGRIVIPKEIRKKLRIKTGDNLEILVEEGNIMLKKYSQIENIEDIISSYVMAFNNVLKYNIIVTDTDKVVAASGNLRKKYLCSNISSELEKMIDRREVIFLNKKSSIQINNNVIEEGYFAASPIINNGDTLGIVIILSLNSPLLAGEDKLALILSSILSNYFI